VLRDDPELSILVCLSTRIMSLLGSAARVETLQPGSNPEPGCGRLAWARVPEYTSNGDHRWMCPNVCIRPAAADEGELLREIAIAAKASWGYDLARVREWAAMGDFSPAGLQRKDVFVASAGDDPVGWAATIRCGNVVWLDDLWIEPAWMDKGVGSKLFDHAVNLARRSGAIRLEWETETNAIGFYEKMGGRYLREGELSIWGRVNPVMGLSLA
jgi:GNAT superfamily N-acetyltransferase